MTKKHWIWVFGLSLLWSRWLWARMLVWEVGMYRLCLLMISLVLLSTNLRAANYSGQYIGWEEGERLLLQVQQQRGQISGYIEVEGYQIPISAQDTGQGFRGTMNEFGDVIPFVARHQGQNLILTYVDPESGQPDWQDQVVFKPATAVAQPSRPPQPNAPPQATSAATATPAISINGQTLNRQQIQQLQRTYQVQPKPGNYWYDSRSGLYGVMGYPAFGFMLPGHEFGLLPAHASAGNTWVFINGRQLPQSEWAIWSQYLGTAIQPGRYWLDHQGNAGYEGNPMPVVNLYAAARQRSSGSSSGSGDNFWTTRFSAGNSDQGGSRGYVSVPGYGPIGYGF